MEKIFKKLSFHQTLSTCFVTLVKFSISHFLIYIIYLIMMEITYSQLKKLISSICLDRTYPYSNLSYSYLNLHDPTSHATNKFYFISLQNKLFTMSAPERDDEITNVSLTRWTTVNWQMCSEGELPVFSREILEEVVRAVVGTRCKRARHVARFSLAKQIYTGVVFSPQTDECRGATTSAALNLYVNACRRLEPRRFTRWANISRGRRTTVSPWFV